MMYKEILDGMLSIVNPAVSEEGAGGVLPSKVGFNWPTLFAHLDLKTDERFSEGFVNQSRAVVVGNGLRFGAEGAGDLAEMVLVWGRYVAALGLGMPEPTMDTMGVGKVKGKGKGKEKGKGKAQDDTTDGEEMENLGRSEDRLELVYRRAGVGPSKKKGVEKDGKVRKEAKAKGKGRRKRGRDTDTVEEEERLVQLAIQESLKSATHHTEPDDVATSHTEGTIFEAEDKSSERGEKAASPSKDDQYKEEDELAWAVEMSLGTLNPGDGMTDTGEVVVRSSQRSDMNTDSIPVLTQSGSSSPLSSPPSSPAPVPVATTTTGQAAHTGSASGSIIGKTVFTHSQKLLKEHLESVLDWWLGHRLPVGVTLEETRRCGWCEFEEGCEWR